MAIFPNWLKNLKLWPRSKQTDIPEPAQEIKEEPWDQQALDAEAVSEPQSRQGKHVLTDYQLAAFSGATMAQPMVGNFMILQTFDLIESYFELKTFLLKLSTSFDLRDMMQEYGIKYNEDWTTERNFHVFISRFLEGKIVRNLDYNGDVDCSLYEPSMEVATDESVTNP